MGALESFEELVYRYESRIYRFVFQYCRNPADASEITQDAFLRAYQALRQFNPRYSFASWLFAIARRKSIDFYRSQPPLAEAEMPELADSEDPAQILCQHEDRQNVWRLARRTLSETQFQALWLKYVEEMEVAEIARAMGKSKTHVKVMLFRARKSLAAEMKKPVVITERISEPIVSVMAQAERCL